MGVELIHADGQTMKLIVAFCDFAYALNKRCQTAVEGVMWIWFGFGFTAGVCDQGIELSVYFL